MSRNTLPANKLAALHDGLVIPAHPLALNARRELDERRQRALTRYYLASGVGGVAVGVHTTQFEIRDPRYGLFERVLSIAAEEVDAFTRADGAHRPVLKVAGICGPADQALSEAETASRLGYDAGLVSMGGLSALSEDDHLSRIRKVAALMPVFGFYLQPAVGGRQFSYQFWRGVAETDGVIAIKMAPFNRYKTLDVVRAVCESSRYRDIALYTGNDDNIIIDLLTTYRIPVDGQVREKRIVGGLLGHWAVWTRRAVELLEEIRKLRGSGTISASWLTRNVQVTDSNAAFFDPPHSFAGSIAGIHEVLRRQGLLEGTWCLNPNEGLSPGQLEEIDRVYAAYPELNDDEFVRQHLRKWLA